MEAKLIHSFDISAAGNGKGLLGDINNDGRMEVVFVQADSGIDDRYVPHQITAVTAYSLEGEILWQHGKVQEKAGNFGSDFPAQIYDFDGDGFLEVLCVMDKKFTVLDGRTGEVKVKYDLPDPYAHDCIIIANLSGGDRAKEIILKNRYEKMWAMSNDFQVLWTHEGNIGHFPYAFDINEDGFDEVMAGYDLLDHNGKLLWSCQNLEDHADCLWVADVNNDGKYEMLVGGSVTCLYDRDGKELWRYVGSIESQHVCPGHFVKGASGLQIAGLDRIQRGDGYKGQWDGKDGIFLIDSEGKELWKEDRTTKGWLTIVDLLSNWNGDGKDYILAYRRGGGLCPALYNSDMERVVEFPNDGYVLHGDLFGRGVEDVITYNSKTLCIYSGRKTKISKPGSGKPVPQDKRLYSSTLYPGGVYPKKQGRKKRQPGTLSFGFKYFKKSMPIAIIAEIMSLLGIFAELLIPLLSGFLIDYCIHSEEVKEDSGSVFHFLLTGKYGEVHTMKLFFSVALVYSILFLLRIVFIYTRDLLQERVGLNLETELRYATYRKLMELDSQTISDYNSGELLQIMNSDTIMFKELFSHRIPYFIDAIFMFIATFILIATLDFSFLIAPAVLAPFLIMTVRNFKKQAKINFGQIRAKSAKMNLTTQENIAGVRIVRSFTNEELEKEKFEGVNLEFKTARLNQIWLSSRFDLTFNAIKQIAYISTIIIGAVLVMNGKLLTGYILTSSTYVMRIMNNITGLNNHIFNMQQQLIAGLALKGFMEKESKVSENGENTLRSDAPHITLTDVSLTIDGQDVLKHINLDIPYGKKVGIVGETGSGKSVLLKTLVRIRDITDGQITIDGHDIKDFTLKNLRDMYSYVFQDVFLFSNTIESNIAFSKPDAEKKMVTDAAEQAKANHFIDALADRYETIVGERGLGISGGQKQRLSIARAFLKNAPVFVLDDSTSALDVGTERELLKNIRENYSEKTVFITAHRFSSVVECDEIIYLRDSEIVERGTFDELMALGGSFAKVYNIQQEQQHSVIDYDALAEGVSVNG